MSGRRASPRRRSRVWQAVRLLLAVLVFLLLWRGHQHLIAWKCSRPEHRLDGTALHVLRMPSWLAFEDVHAIHEDSGIAGEALSYFTPDLEARLDAAFRRSPWIARIRRVRRAAPDRVELELELRYDRPVAGVRGADGLLYLVGAGGERLPGARTMPPAGLGHPLRVIEGVELPPPVPGEVWSDAVRQGARVAREILALSPEACASAALERIDVSNVGGRRDRLAPEIVLVSTGGTVVEWGRCALAPLGELEAPAGDKVRRLERAVAAYPGFAGLRKVKLQFDELIVEEIDARPLERLAPDVHGG